ncbi:hypothetical protein EVAR_92396_1 [Eumeta japonica]|uniref:Uncharacterized protein n=1 Tax=Eumeta variegata TaxID=151549 RepID=A0A4C1TLC9_EUMVA|nr:hypothetical protein EVAR_92396_1 [Eumeta japonica]
MIYIIELIRSWSQEVENGWLTGKLIDHLVSFNEKPIIDEDDPMKNRARSTWLPPPMDIHGSREVTSALPASWEGIGYLIVGIGLTDEGTEKCANWNSHLQNET